MSRSAQPQRAAKPNQPGSRALDPMVVEAAREVDVTLLDWALSLTPRERLRACTNATVALGKFSIWRSPGPT